jgi:hypothetical protein
MTDLEFDILDELYFIQPFQELRKNVRMEEKELLVGLRGLLSKGWLRCFTAPDEEVHFEENTFNKDYHQYYYLASKEGLLAHNSKI